MRNIAGTAAMIAGLALTLVPLAGADPAAGHGTYVRIQSPPMRCEVGSDDSGPVPGVPGMGPNVVCQTAGFPNSPMDPPPSPDWTGDPLVLHQDQAIVTASGQFNWRTANLGMALPGQPDTVVVEGQTYQLQAWTVVATGNGITFTNDATGHGMVIDSSYNVNSF